VYVTSVLPDSVSHRPTSLTRSVHFFEDAFVAATGLPWRGPAQDGRHAL